MSVLSCIDCGRTLATYEARDIPNGQGGVFVAGASLVGPFCPACFAARLSPNPPPAPVATLARFQ